MAKQASTVKKIHGHNNLPSFHCSSSRQYDDVIRTTGKVSGKHKILTIPLSSEHIKILSYRFRRSWPHEHQIVPNKQPTNLSTNQLTGQQVIHQKTDQPARRPIIPASQPNKKNSQSKMQLDSQPTNQSINNQLLYESCKKYQSLVLPSDQSIPKLRSVVLSLGKN